MPRRKQTARKATGGRLPRAALGIPPLPTFRHAPSIKVLPPLPGTRRHIARFASDDDASPLDKFLSRVFVESAFQPRHTLAMSIDKWHERTVEEEECASQIPASLANTSKINSDNDGDHEKVILTALDHPK